MLIHCNKGKHRTGCLIGCIRKIQRWSHTYMHVHHIYIYNIYTYTISKCMCICIYVYPHTCACECYTCRKLLRIYILDKNTCKQIYMYLHTFTHMHVHIYAHIFIYTHIYICIYIYIYMYVYIYRSICDEYRRFSYPKSRTSDQQFIELFDVSQVQYDIRYKPIWLE